MANYFRTLNMNNSHITFFTGVRGFILHSPIHISNGDSLAESN